MTKNRYAFDLLPRGGHCCVAVAILTGQPKGEGPCPRKSQPAAHQQAMALLLRTAAQRYLLSTLHLLQLSEFPHGSHGLLPYC